MKESQVKAILAATVLGTSLPPSLAADHKHPKDPCPPGTREVTIERTTTVRGDAQGEARGKIINGRGTIGGEKTTRETEKVCRDVPKKEGK